ncbi:transmembrane glucosamine N-acetyltransferase NagX [Aliikangiella sp. IMCC44359]|uniref:transmembrane glucosamine N-acetyltransferase NagX n=1 Tax=Aliikangiella sp. IMCC44359 TaxID=3459125 RepID=UPI00403ABE17
MIWILGAEGLFSALFVLTGWSVWQSLSNQFVHSEWHGFTFYDLIFPLFIFLSGVTLGIANKSLIKLPYSQRLPIYKKAFTRVILLCIFGVVYNHGWGTGIPIDAEKIRYASVLMRIAIAWFFCALIVWHFSFKWQVLITLGILIFYWLWLCFIPTPDGHTGVLTIDQSWNSWVDQHWLPGITYRAMATDPEGLLSHFPAITNALLGAFAGRLLILQALSNSKRIKWLVVASISCLVLGYLWAQFFPLNKVLWTSSFALVTTGWSGLLLALFYFIIDVCNWRTLGIIFAVVGANAILLYLLSSIMNWEYLKLSLFGGIINEATPSWQPLMSVCFSIVIQWLIAWYLYSKNILFKV